MKNTNSTKRIIAAASAVSLAVLLTAVTAMNGVKENIPEEPIRAEHNIQAVMAEAEIAETGKCESETVAETEKYEAAVTVQDEHEETAETAVTSISEVSEESASFAQITEYIAAQQSVCENTVVETAPVTEPVFAEEEMMKYESELGKNRGMAAYGTRGVAFFGSKNPEGNKIVIREDGYLKVNFLKDKNYQSQINSDIRTLTDEKYSDSSRAVQVYTVSYNGYLFLTFYNKNDINGWENINTLTYDIIEQKKITSAEELFTNTFGMYEMLSEACEASEYYEGNIYKGEVTAENITGFDWQALYFEGDREFFWNEFTLIDCDGYGRSELAKFCKVNYLREMDDCIDDAFLGFYEVNRFE